MATSRDGTRRPRLVIDVERVRRGRELDWGRPDPLAEFETAQGPWICSYQLARVAWIGAPEGVERL